MSVPLYLCLWLCCSLVDPGRALRFQDEEERSDSLAEMKKMDTEPMADMDIEDQQGPEFGAMLEEMGLNFASMYMPMSEISGDTQEALDYLYLPNGDTQENQEYLYMPKYDLAVCCCAKCGSTSFYGFLHQQLYGTSTPPGNTAPHGWSHEKWNEFSKISAQQLMGVKNSFAVMRDPKERLISSWKSKIACGSKWNTDTTDRARIVPQLLELASKDDDGKHCLEFDEFLETMKAVHDAGKASLLNPHLRPQQYGCFKDLKPSQWTFAAAISDPGFSAKLAEMLGDDSKPEFPHKHRSTEHTNQNNLFNIEATSLLDEVTRSEYEGLEISQSDASHPVHFSAS